MDERSFAAAWFLSRISSNQTKTNVLLFSLQLTLIGGFILFFWSTLYDDAGSQEGQPLLYSAWGVIVLGLMLSIIHLIRKSE